MKKLIKTIRNWRYRRLYRRLFFIYAGKEYDADYTGNEAAKAFQWITGREWKNMI